MVAEPQTYDLDEGSNTLVKDALMDDGRLALDFIRENRDVVESKLRQYNFAKNWERDIGIFLRWCDNGETYGQLGVPHGISGNRVMQIIHKFMRRTRRLFHD